MRNDHFYVSCFAGRDEICVGTAHKNGTEPSIAEAIQLAEGLRASLRSMKLEDLHEDETRVVSGRGGGRHRSRSRRRPEPASAQNTAAVSIGNTDIGGVVTGPNGPEAGVWVIAETTDLPTKMNKTVVTDDQGRYVIPDLPKANYTVWARGYGLVDSAKTTSEPGKIVNITAVPAPNDAAAAEILSGDLLVLDAQDSGQEHVPGHRHRRERQRHGRPR